MYSLRMQQRHAPHRFVAFTTAFAALGGADMLFSFLGLTMLAAGLTLKLSDLEILACFRPCIRVAFPDLPMLRCAAGRRPIVHEAIQSQVCDPVKFTQTWWGYYN